MGFQVPTAVWKKTAFTVVEDSVSSPDFVQQQYDIYIYIYIYIGTAYSEDPPHSSELMLSVCRIICIA